MKKLASLILTLVLCMGLAVPAMAVEFSDVPTDHPFRDAISYCAEKGIVGGYEDGTFKPTNTVSQMNFCVMLSRAFYPDDIIKYSTPPYTISKPTDANLSALTANNITDGVSFTDSLPSAYHSRLNTGISRYDMALLMSNVMNQKGFASSDSEKSAAISQISDYASIPTQYQDAVANVYAKGIIGGFSDGSFGGEKTMNRGQAAVVIYRLTKTVDRDPSTMQEIPADIGKPEAAPATPSTGKTLVDGSTITEANVMRLMEARVAEWGNQKWGNANSVVPVYTGGQSGDVKNTVYQYVVDGTTGTRVSCAAGCGGWATYLSDAAFGNTGFPLRKTTVDNIRAGDIIIQLTDGKINHIAIASGKTNVRDFGRYTVTYYGRYEANAGTVPGHSPNGIDPTAPACTTNYDSNTGYSYVIYTRYPN